MKTLSSNVTGPAAESELMTLAEAAPKLRIGLSTAKSLARQGKLPGLVGKVGSQWRVNRRLLEDFINTGEKHTPESV